MITYLRKLVLASCLMVIMAIGVLHIPVVQETLFSKLLRNLNNTTAYTFTYKNIKITWLQNLIIEGLEVKDPQKKVLFHIQHLHCTMNPVATLRKRQIDMAYLAIDGAQIYLEEDKKEKLNLAYFIAHFFKGNKPVVIHNTTFNGGKVTLQSKKLGKINQKLACIQCSKLQGKCSNISMRPGVTSCTINTFSCTDDNNPLHPYKFSTQFDATASTIQLKGLSLQTQYSTIQGDCYLSSTGKEPVMELLSWDNPALQVQLVCKEVRVATEDLGIFFPFLKKRDIIYRLAGVIAGNVNDFTVKVAQFQFGQGSMLQGKATIKNWLHAPSYTIAIGESRLNTGDIVPYIGTIPSYIASFEQFVIKEASLDGDVSKCTLCANIATPLGIIIPNITFALNDAINYEGTIVMDNFAIGRLLKDKKWGNVSMKSHVVGSGCNLANAHINWEAKVNKIGIYDYEYQHIDVDGSFNNGSIEGNILINDPNIQLAATFALNRLYSKNHQSLTTKGALQHIALDKLHLTSVPVQLSASFDLVLENFSLQKPIGILKMNQLNCNCRDGQPLKLGYLNICITTTKEDYLWKINSELVDMTAQGKFTYANLVQDFNKLLTSINSSEKKMEALTSTPQPYAFNYKIHLKEIVPLLNVYLPDITLCSNIIMEGKLTRGKEVDFVLKTANIPNIIYGKNSFMHTDIAILYNQAAGSNVKKLTINIQSESQKWVQKYMTEQFSMLITLVDREVKFQQYIKNKSNKDQLSLKGEGLLCNNFIQLKLDPSILKTGTSQWSIVPENKIIVTKKDIQFHNCSISNGQEEIILMGKVSFHKKSRVEFQIKDFLLNNFNELLNKNILGKINGKGRLCHAVDHPIFTGDIVIDNMVIDGLPIGDLHASTEWDNEQKKIAINASLYQEKEQRIRLTGLYNPRQKKDSLALKVHLVTMPIATFSPFLKGVFSELDGTIAGSFMINGNFLAYSIHGNGAIKDALFKVNYLNTSYTLNSTFTCAHQTIYFNKVKLRDKKEGMAILSGHVFYKKKGGIHIDLAGSMENMFVLNTSQQGDSKFYGTGKATGDITFLGPVKELVIQVKAITKEGDITITNTDTMDYESQPQLVQFRNLQSLNSKKNIPVIVPTIKGLTLILDLEITPAVVATVLLNKRRDDFLQGKGKGSIRVEVGVEKPLNLVGNYKFEEGTCTFSVFGLIRKYFDIQAGSQVTWNGDPYSGLLKFKANYEQSVSTTSLLPASTPKGYQKKLPVQVVLVAKGILAAPQVNFCIDFKEKAEDQAIQNAITRLQARILSDKHYLDSQVFSLMTLRRFYSDIQTDIAGALGGSMSELIGQNIYKAVTSLDQNLAIELDLGLQNWDNLFEDTKAVLSYNLLNNNLLISSSLGSYSRLIDDWMITYNIPQVKNMRIKAYKIPQQGKNFLGSVGGISVTYTRNFGK